MLELDYISEFALDPYPNDNDLWFFQRRSAASVAAVGLLRLRVAAGNVAGTLRALDYLRGGAAPALGVDNPVRRLERLNRPGRFSALLDALSQDLAIPNDYVGEPDFIQLKYLYARASDAITGQVNDEYDMAGWFAYFWQERTDWAADVLTDEDKTRFTEFLNLFFTRPAQLALHARHAERGVFARLANGGAAGAWFGGHSLTKRMDADGIQSRWDKLAGYNPDNISRQYKFWAFALREALAVMLRAGFVPIATCDENKKIVGIPPDEVLTRYRAWGDLDATRQRVTRGVSSSQANLLYCWRGDNRPPRDIQQAGGFWCMVDSGDYGRQKNVDELWHPFSAPQYRKYLYFRLSQMDNCLRTAVSITPVSPRTGPPHRTLDFTQLDDDAFKINVTFPNIENVAANKKRQRNIQGTGGLDATHWVDEVLLYLCVLPRRTRFVDTAWLQMQIDPAKGFPEIAVRGIPYSCMKGYVLFIRVHHTPDDHDHSSDHAHGFTAIPVLDRSENRDPDDPTVTRLYQAAIAGSFEGKWTPTGIAPPDAGPHRWAGRYVIQQVHDMAVNGGQIAEYENYR